METNMSGSKIESAVSSKMYYWIYFAVSIVFWAAYLYITFTSPIDPQNKFGLTEHSTRLIQVSLVVPIFLIWVLGIYSVKGLTRYLSLIKGSDEVRGLSKISVGIAILVFGLAFNSAFGAIRSHYIPTTNLHDILGLMPDYTREEILRLLTIIRNYLSLGFTTIPYVFMFLGARDLINKYRLVENFRSRLFFPAFSLILSAIIYFMLFSLNPIRQSSPYQGVEPTYYLSDLVIVLTISLPYVLSWGLGLMAALGVNVYKYSVTAPIYKNALSKFSLGFITIVSTSILFQIISTIGYQLRDLSLSAILIIVYILVAIIGLGYIFLAWGANKLSKIESV